MKEKKLKKAIQELKLDEPSEAFSTRILSHIEASENLSLEPAIYELLKTNLVSDPSARFTGNILDQLKPKKQLVVEPVVSRQTWWIITGVVILILGIAILSPAKSATGSATIRFWSISVVYWIDTFSQQMIPFLVVVSSLFLGDYYLRRKWRLAS